MLHRSRSSTPAKKIITFIVLGIFAGVGFFIYDNYDSLFDSPAVTATPTAVAAAPTSTLPSTPTPPAGDTAAIPATQATLFIPSVGIRGEVITAIIRGNTWDITNMGTHVGYLQGTAWIGEPGNIVLSGHVEMSDGRQGIFAPLLNIAVGDEVMLTEEATEYRYRVRETKHVEPTDLSVVYPTQTDVLTLITCADYNFIRNIYETRFVVIADPV